MNENKKIKIIKRGVGSKPEPSSIQREKTKRQAAREMVANVSNWVSEVQARKSTEAKLAFESLFKQVPSPSET